jgi:hypothetical protein|tara:strand:- start:918 stop:1163 length:246 start_codon:yes stop_codon:yes gene_type:complete
MLGLGSRQTLCNDVFENRWLLGGWWGLISCVVFKLAHEDEPGDVNVLEFFVPMALANDEKEREQAVLALEELGLELFIRLG